MTPETVALDEVSHVTDQELVTRLRRLVRADQTLTVRLLVHLAELDARGLYREHAYASTFTYCVQALGMSEAQAYVRIQAARSGRQFPRVLQLLAQGALHLTAIKLLGPHLTADNHMQLLERARGKAKRELELLVATIAPKPDVPSRTRKLPEPRCPARPRAPFAPTPVEAKPPSAVDASQPMNALPEACEPSREPRTGRSTATASLDTSDAPFDRACDSNRSSFALEAPRPGAPFAPTPVEARLPSAVDANQPMNALSEARDPDREPPLSSTATASLEPSDAPFDHACDPNPAPFALQAPRQRGSSKPLRPGRYKVEFTAGQALHDKLTQLQDLLRHQVSDGDLAVLVERAVDLLIDNTMKQRFAQTRAPQKTRAAEKSSAPQKTRAVEKSSAPQKTRAAERRPPVTANSRYIPRAVVREVHQRDAGQCTFVSSDGTRCSERGFLELHHHDRPYARGGKATIENLRLVCRAHNSLFAERDYGRRFMRSKLQTRESNDPIVSARQQL